MWGRASVSLKKFSASFDVESLTFPSRSRLGWPVPHRAEVHIAFSECHAMLPVSAVQLESARGLGQAFLESASGILTTLVSCRGLRPASTSKSLPLGVQPLWTPSSRDSYRRP